MDVCFTTVIPSFHREIETQFYTSKPSPCYKVTYFARIILVFIFLWLPGMTLYGFVYATAPLSLQNQNYTILKGRCYMSAYLLFAIQCIITFVVSMLKPDVKKAVIDLVTFSVCCNTG